jgi:D-3-phosphoglycerate dehydrogenase
MTREELQERVSDIDAVVAGADTWDEAVFSLAPKLKIIARFGVGLDNIDVEAAGRFGIKVTSAAGKNANAVAELAIGLMLAALRGIPYLHQATRRGGWDRFVGEEMEGKKVGLLGFGAIARKVARKLSGFEVEINAYDKDPDLDAARELNVSLISAEKLLQVSDIVCLLLPSLKETYHFMRRETFSRMKDGAYFINVARGALVDEKALFDALVSGKLKAAAIDVYEVEPVSADNPLFGLTNLVTTPHTAAETYKSYREVGLHTARAILEVLDV